MTTKQKQMRRDHLRFVIHVWQARAHMRGGQWAVWAADKIAQAQQALRLEKL